MSGGGALLKKKKKADNGERIRATGTVDYSRQGRAPRSLARCRVVGACGPILHGPRPCFSVLFFFQAEDGIRDESVTGVQTCALPIWTLTRRGRRAGGAVEGGHRR